MNCNENKFSINGGIDIEVREIGNEKTKIIIIDGFSSKPNDLIDYVITKGKLTCTKEKYNFYPGVTCPAENNYTKVTYAILKPIIKQIYRLPVAYPASIESTYGMVTFDPSELNQDQKIPHYDSTSTGQLAVLHYLCEAPFEGTAFYRHKKTGYETITNDRKNHYWSFAKQKLENNSYPDQYANNGNDDYDKFEYIDVKFNRLIIYPSKLLHSSMINPEHLSSNPLKGRLTLRTFITY